MTVANHAEMHFEHKQLLNETALWQDEVSHWRQEFSEALAGLDRLKTALTSHAEALQNYAAELDRECTRLEEHERSLADYERGGTGSDLIPLAQEHAQELARHIRRRDVQERIKKHHHMLLAQWHLLFSALTKPM